MAELDWDKYELSYLKNKSFVNWTDLELEKLIDAFANEDIAPFIEIPFTEIAINSYLNESYCRCCGKCCLGYLNDLGLTATEDELRKIARHSKYTYKYIKRRSIKYKHTERNDVRLLPQPCMFYQQGECKVYQWRPLICRIYPISNLLSGGDVRITISLRCDYGKDLYRSLLRYKRKKGDCSAV